MKATGEVLVPPCRKRNTRCWNFQKVIWIRQSRVSVTRGPARMLSYGLALRHPPLKYRYCRYAIIFIAHIFSHALLHIDINFSDEKKSYRIDKTLSTITNCTYLFVKSLFDFQKNVYCINNTDYPI